MEIVITNKKLAKIIDNDNKLIETVGNEYAKKIRQRCAELEASNNFKEYLDINLGNPHSLQGNLKSFFGVKISKNVRLIIEPLSEKLDDESLRKCEKVNLKGVGDYHGGKINWYIP